MKYVIVYVLKHRDAPEPTGDEPDDCDFEMPKVYEPVSSQLVYNKLKKHILDSLIIFSWVPIL